MPINFKELMTKKSDDGLMDYLKNSNKYTPQAISAAVDELKRRGRNFTDDELNDIKVKIQASEEREKSEVNLFTSNPRRKNIVTDESAPLFYSQEAIWVFSVFSSVIFGSILMASNISDTKRKWTVIGFGVGYTAIVVVGLNLIPPNLILLIVLNAAGALGLNSTFWDKYIGKDTKYRQKSVWKPLIISIIIAIVFAIVYLRS